MKKELISEWTRDQLARSLFDFMREKPLDRISVTEVSAACGIPRSTFYYHFDDIYDLTSWAMSDRLLKCLGDDNCFLWGEGLLELFRQSKRHARVCRCAIESAHIWQMADSYCRRCMTGIMVGMRRLDGDRGTDPELLRFIALFYGHGVLATLVAWFRGNMQEEPEDIVRKIDFIAKGSLPILLDRADDFQKGNISSWPFDGFEQGVLPEFYTKHSCPRSA